MMVKDYNLKQVERTVTEAIELAADWGRAYREASPSIRRQINQAFFRCFLIDSTGVAGAIVTDEFASLLTNDLVQRFERQVGDDRGATPSVRALPAPLVSRSPRRLFSSMGSSNDTLVSGVFPKPSWRAQRATPGGTDHSLRKGPSTADI